MSTARKKNKTTNVTRRISPKDRFFKQLELECVVFMNYHSECSISAKSNTIFEKGADKLFKKNINSSLQTVQISPVLLPTAIHQML